MKCRVEQRVIRELPEEDLLECRFSQAGEHEDRPAILMLQSEKSLLAEAMNDQSPPLATIDAA